MIYLTSLKSQLQGDVPASNGVPSTEQYEQAAKDAVADLSRKVPLHRLTTLSIVSGTASYALPADFYKLIRLQALGVPAGSGIYNTPQGLVPFGPDFQERVMLAGRTLTLSPTPGYTTTREMEYAALHVLDDDGAYPDLTDDVAAVAMLKARSLALRHKASVAANAGFRYQIGDEMVDKSGLAGTLLADVQAAEAEYQAAIASLQGTVTLRGRVDSWVRPC